MKQTFLLPHLKTSYFYPYILQAPLLSMELNEADFFIYEIQPAILAFNNNPSARIKFFEPDF